MTLTSLTVLLTGIAAIPTNRIGGTDAVSMLALGSGLALVIVLGGYFSVRLFLRGPKRVAVSMMVAGFVTRLALLFSLLAVIVLTTSIDPTRFLLWTVAFYFVLVMVEAILLFRQGLELEEGTPR